MRLNIALGHCPRKREILEVDKVSPFPYISVTCEGGYCKNWFLPCESDDQCGDGTCVMVEVSDIESAFQDFMASFGLVENEEFKDMYDVSALLLEFKKMIRRVFGDADTAAIMDSYNMGYCIPDPSNVYFATSFEVKLSFSIPQCIEYNCIFLIVN